MANPRNILDYDGQAAEYLPFKIDASTITYDATKAGGSVSVDLAVTMVAAQTVGLCADGDPVVGKLILVEADNKCTVQVEGTMKLPAGNAAAVTYGKKIVGALGAASAKGYIREAATPTGSYVQGTATDAANGRGFIINGGTTTAVEVML